MDYEISARRVNDLEHSVRTLTREQHRLHELDNKLDDMQGGVESLRHAIDDVEQTVREHTGECEDQAARLSSELSTAARTLARLEDSMGWVEHHIRATATAADGEFDAEGAPCSSKPPRVGLTRQHTNHPVTVAGSEIQIHPVGTRLS